MANTLIMGHSLPINECCTFEEAEQILFSIMNNLNIFIIKNKDCYRCETYNCGHITFEIEIHYIKSVYIIYFKQQVMSSMYRDVILHIATYILKKYKIVWNPNVGIQRGQKHCDIKMEISDIVSYLDDTYKYKLPTYEYMHVRLYFEYCGLIELNPVEPLFTINCPYFKHILQYLFTPIRHDIFDKHFVVDDITFMLYQLDMIYKVLHLPYIIEEFIHYIIPIIKVLTNNENPFVQLYALKVADYIHNKLQFKSFYNSEIILCSSFTEANLYFNALK